MDAKTLEALKGSIAKWEAVVEGAGEDNGADNCPLCLLFCRGPDRSCAGCPVQIATGCYGCEDTPYDAWTEAHAMEDDRPWSANTEELVGIAQAELDFLKSLLPTDR